MDNNIPIEVMVNKLKELYNKQDIVKLQLEEVNESIEFLETMIMFKFNQEKREEEKFKKSNWLKEIKK